jgi:hypothetical protein
MVSIQERVIMARVRYFDRAISKVLVIRDLFLFFQVVLFAHLFVYLYFHLFYYLCCSPHAFTKNELRIFLPNLEKVLKVLYVYYNLIG